MQVVSAALQAELNKGQNEPRILVDLYEFYDYDYTPTASGFDPADAIESFAAEEITWNGQAYRRELISRGDIVRNMGEKTNSCTLTFSNISRYMATLAQSQEIEGLFLVIRCVCPTVTDDSLVLFVGRCDKPSDIDKEEFTLSARQDFGNINQTLPPSKFMPDDPEGRLPTDPLYEGIPFVAIAGSYTYPVVQPSTSFFGRLFGRRDTTSAALQWSSIDNTPYGQAIPEIFGRCQMQLIPFIWADKGVFVSALMAACRGPIAAIENIKTRVAGISDPINSFGSPPVPAIVHLGDPGGTGTNQGNTGQADLGAGGKFSHLAYIEGAFIPLEYFSNPTFSDPSILNEPPIVTALIKGRKVPLPNASGVYGATGWTDNPVHIARFVLTDSNWINIDDAFMEDTVNYQTALHCDAPLIDDTNDQLIIIPSVDINQAGVSFARFRATGLYTPEYYKFHELLLDVPGPETDDGPYVPWNPEDPFPPQEPPDIPGGNPTFIRQIIPRKRYTCNVPITGEIRGVDFLHKIVFPAFKGYMRVNKRGKYEIRSEQQSDNTFLRTATAVGATSIPILNVLHWKTGDLLVGQILLGFGLITSEVRKVTSAVYSTSGNSITLSVSKTGTITITASGATLSGGSTTTPATGTITIGGTPATGNIVTATINGIAIQYTLTAGETTGTVAAMLATHINADQRLNKYIKATWVSSSPTVITLTCLHGALNVDSALLKAHAVGVVDPASAPTVAAAASGALAAGVYRVAYADVTAVGMTALTPVASVTLAVNQKINVSSLPAFPAGVTSRHFYLSKTAGSEELRYFATRTDVVNFSINALPENGAALPPSYNTTAEELIRVAIPFATNSQDVYSVWPASTLVALNDTYLPSTPNGHKYRVSTAGTTAASEPTWPTAAGGTVASGTSVFTEDGSTVLKQAGLTRSNVKIGSFKWPLGSRQSSVNQVKGNFRDARNDFALTPFIVNDRAHQLRVKKKYPLDVDLSAVDNTHQMERIAGFLLSKHREGDWFYSLGTGPQGLVLEEGDVICASDASGGLINIVTRVEDLRIHPNHDVTIGQARKYSSLMFSDDVGSHTIPMASSLRWAQTVATKFIPLDIPMFRETDYPKGPGLYFPVNRSSISGDWRGTRIYSDVTGKYLPITNEIDVAVPMGNAVTALSTTSNITTEDTVSTFRVKITTPGGGQATYPLASSTAEKIAEGANLAAIGIHGRWELVQFRTVTPVGGTTDTYDLRNFMRGRHGTHGNTSNHAVTDQFVLLTDPDGDDMGAVYVPINKALVGRAFNLKAVTTNEDVATALAQRITWAGLSVLISSVVTTATTIGFDGTSFTVKYAIVAKAVKYQLSKTNDPDLFTSADYLIKETTSTNFTLPIPANTPRIGTWYFRAVPLFGNPSLITQASYKVSVPLAPKISLFQDGPSYTTFNNICSEAALKYTTFQKTTMESAADPSFSKILTKIVGPGPRTSNTVQLRLPKPTGTPKVYIRAYFSDVFGNGAYGLFSISLPTNVALIGVGAVASASSVLSASYPALAAHNGDRKGLNPTNKGLWTSAATLTQVETATVAGTITGSGNVSVTITASGLTGSPRLKSVAVLVGDTASVVAGKIRVALAADSVINAFFIVTGTGTSVILTKRQAAANDATLNIALANGTSTGLTAAPTSANTRAGVAMSQWLQIAFNGPKKVNEINVLMAQDGTPVEPTLTTAFTLKGLVDFLVQYWNGSTWVTVTGGTVTGNNKVWKQFKFTTVTTTKIRVLATKSIDNYARLAELEAWGTQP